jgi:hypothetical protein
MYIVHWFVWVLKSLQDTLKYYSIKGTGFTISKNYVRIEFNAWSYSLNGTT